MGTGIGVVTGTAVGTGVGAGISQGNGVLVGSVSRSQKIYNRANYDRAIGSDDLDSLEWSRGVMETIDKPLPSKYYSLIMTSERVQQHVNRLLDEVDAAVAELDWEQVRERSQAVLDLSPDNVDAQQLLSAAERNLSRSGPPSEPPLPAEAFAALISNDNLFRVWHFDPSSQDIEPDFGWFLYDPRPVFAAANTVTTVEAGKFYWINVRDSQTANICGRPRTLFAGWNPLTI